MRWDMATADFVMKVDVDDSALAELRSLVERMEAAADRAERAKSEPMAIHVYPGGLVTSEELSRSVVDAIERASRRK
jgi:hypothetical protein